LSSGGWPATQLSPPRQRKILHDSILDEILQERVVSSRNRINARGVKRKMSNYNLRPRKRQPTRHLDVSRRIKTVK
jgi:hypothetical protein